jgi:hypothetical protein
LDRLTDGAHFGSQILQNPQIQFTQASTTNIPIKKSTFAQNGVRSEVCRDQVLHRQKGDCLIQSNPRVSPLNKTK